MRVLLAVCLGAVLLVSGCGFKDIDKRSFVVALGFDVADENADQYKVTAKIAIPTGDPKQGESDFVLVEQEADTIGEALRLLKSQTDKELDYGQTKMILIGEEMMRRDIVPILEFLTRRRDIQLIAYVAMARPDAKQVLQVKPKQERIAGNYLFYTFSETGSESPYIYTAYLSDVFRRVNDQGIDPVLPIVKARKDFLEINRVAMLKHNKYAFELPPRETKLYRMLEHNVENTTMHINYKGGRYVPNIERAHSSFRITANGEQGAVIHVKVKASGILEEKHGNGMVTKEILSALAREEERELGRQTKNLLQKIQGKSVDPLGLGLRYKATHFEDTKTEWSTWQKLYPKAKFNVQVQAQLETPGVIK